MIEQALVFIGSAIILVPVFQRLGLGSVLGYLMAGIVVGPQGLQWIKDPESIQHLAELGVVLLLFMIGLEIQPRKFWSMRRHLLGLGGTQIALTTVVFCAVAMAFGLSAPVAIAIGFGLSLSSTAFALQTLAEQNQLSTEFGRSSFSILLMQDLTAIPALAIIPALGATHDIHGVSWQGSLLVLAVICILLVASRFLIRPAFRFVASTRSREIFTAATLFIVLGVAATMQAIGVSAALGTFIAGVLLADSEYRHELESNIEPFKSLLMGLFFIAVGMGVRLDLIASQPILLLALTVGYLAVKLSVIYFSARLFGLSHDNSKLTALTIAQGGEFAFVIFTIALQNQLASSDLLAMLAVVITLSMALNPILMMVHGKWLRRKPGEEPQYDMIEGEEPDVIIAGFGRFGQIFGRVLRAQNIPFVAIDHDPEQIEMVRRFGNKVYYGDASREDLLEAAGARRAKFLVLAIDDVEMSLNTARTVLEVFPHLKILARARNRGHVFDLKDLGIHTVKRETFDSSAAFVQELLVAMGYPPQRASNLIQHFKRHDEIMLEEQYKVRSDDKMFISVSKQGVVQLAQVLQQDSLQSYVEPAPPSP